MLHALFHQAAPLFPCGCFLVKNLSLVTLVKVIRSVLAQIREGMSVINGHGNLEKLCFHSHSIWSSMIQPDGVIGGGGGVARGRSMNKVA